MHNDEVPVRPYTIKQLAAFYQISIPTLRKWLDKLQPALGPRTGHFYNLKQVRIIFDHIGAPFIAFFGTCFELFVSISEAISGESNVAYVGSDDDDDPAVEILSDSDDCCAECETFILM